MPERDLALLIDAAHLAGRIALSHWRKSPRVWEKPDGQGPVSEADLEVNRALEAHLRTQRPDYGWLSEESTDGAARLDTESQFILDPIDGTRSFLQGEDSFCHALAVVRGGAVVAGVVFLPAQDKLYAASLTGPATLNGRQIEARPCNRSEGAQVLTGKVTLAPELWPGGVPALDRHFRASMAWRICLVAEGAFDAMLTLRPAWEWDIAAGCLIAARAGACVSDRSGQALRFNARDPRSAGVVVAPPGLHGDLIHRLTAPRP
ncbi:3'(2'),5'-bisphosphate nucleotidase CysQ [bacterium]|nr:3'(2'),5'-bisphosphate nucleotidase CysQ [bacterium]